MMTKEPLMPDIERLIRKSASLTERLPLPTHETLPKEFVDIAEQIGELTGQWNPVELYTPDNAHAEKDRFFEEFIADRVYHPQFTYSNAENFTVGSSREQLTKLYQRVIRHKPVDRIEHLARVALRYKIQDDLTTLDLAQGFQKKDEDKIRRALAQKYPGVDDQLWQTAQEINRTRLTGRYKVPTSVGLISEAEKAILEKRNFNPEEVASAVSWALSQYGILRTSTLGSGYSVVIDEKCTAIDVRDKSVNGPTVFVPKKRFVPMDGVKLLKMLPHEITGHARQSINGSKLFFIGGGRLKVDDETFYEGLAKRYDDEVSRKLFGTEEGIPYPHYVYAVRAAEQGKSFYDIFCQLLEMWTREETLIPEGNLPKLTDLDDKLKQKVMGHAWAMTLKVIRGHLDTSNGRAFAMNKDLCYLRGWLIDRQLREHGFGHLNESAIVARGGLQLLAEFSLSETDLPIPYEDVATRYWQEVLKPQLSRHI